MKIVMVKMDAL